MADMKKTGNFFVALLVLAGLAGCAMFFDEPETDPGMARVSLSAGSYPAARSIAGDLVPLSDATQYDNTYTAVFRNGGQVHTFDFSSIASPRIFDIPAGTYDILVLAGYTPPSPPSTSKYLLGSGYVQNKALSSGNNPVTVNLLTIDVACSLPPSVTSGTALAGTLWVDLRNPLLAAGAITGLFAGTITFTIAPSGNSAYSLTTTAPSTTGSYNAVFRIGLTGANNLSLPPGWCVSDSLATPNDPYTTRFYQPVNVTP
jgi:hypothetical protein